MTWLLRSASPADGGLADNQCGLTPPPATRGTQYNPTHSSSQRKTINLNMPILIRSVIEHISTELLSPSNTLNSLVSLGNSFTAFGERMKGGRHCTQSIGAFE